MTLDKCALQVTVKTYTQQMASVNTTLYFPDPHVVSPEAKH